jgi:ribosomal-protein-alanine N-acetyltransferase
MNIRLSTAADIPALIRLERQSPTAGHWEEEQYRQIFLPSESSAFKRLALVVDEDLASGVATHILGFVVARHIGPEWELENIVVAAAARRKGLGGRLLGELLRRIRETGSESVFLEVRESNRGARALYQKWGFQETGRRKRYYGNPQEDAILYRLQLALRRI